jgi:multiple sugar transport system permease protein
VLKAERLPLVNTWLGRARARWRKHASIVILLAPASVAFVLIVLYPLVYGIYLGLTKTDPTTLQSQFVGLGNYVKMTRDTVFWVSLQLTLTYATMTLLIELPLAFGIALLLNEEIRGRWVYRGLLMLPWVMPNIAASVIWGWLLSADYGLLNYLLTRLGIIDHYVAWLSRGNLALPSAMAIGIWKGLPFTAIVLLAGLQTIPRELHESAEVDGANVLQRLWHITLQHMRPVLVIILVLRFAWAFNTFDLVYVLTAGGPGYSTYLLSIYMYLTAFSFRELGYGSAIATVMLLILLALAAVFIRTVSRKDD